MRESSTLAWLRMLRISNPFATSRRVRSSAPEKICEMFISLQMQPRSAKFCQISEGLFSAVWKSIFAIKCSFCTLFQNLQDLRTFALLQIHVWKKSGDEKAILVILKRQAQPLVAQRIVSFCCVCEKPVSVAVALAVRVGFFLS